MNKITFYLEEYKMYHRNLFNSYEIHLLRHFLKFESFDRNIPDLGRY